MQIILNLKILIISEILQIEMENCLWLPKKDDYYYFKKSLKDNKITKMSFSKIKAFLNNTNKKNNTLVKPRLIKNLILKILIIPNIIPIIISRKIINLIKDKDFIGSMKYGCGAIIFPIGGLYWFNIGLFLQYNNMSIYIICSAFQWLKFIIIILL